VCDKSYTLQGGESDCFYVVGSGEFEVLATQVYKICHLIAVLISFIFVTVQQLSF